MCTEEHMLQLIMSSCKQFCDTFCLTSEAEIAWTHLDKAIFV